MILRCGAQRKFRFSSNNNVQVDQLVGVRCIQNVIAASENFARPDFSALIDAVDQAMMMVIGFPSRELPENSLRFFFATIMT
jgi:hypothetical protein